MFEAVQFIEREGSFELEETILCEYNEEMDAVDVARCSRQAFMDTGSVDYAWWVVRKKGARLANFITDSRSDKEFVLDLRCSELIEPAR